jgi:hypothetical protein
LHGPVLVIVVGSIAVDGLGATLFVAINVTIAIYFLFFRARPLLVDTSGESRRLAISADGYLLTAALIGLIAIGVTVTFLVTWDYIHLPLLGFLALLGTWLLWSGLRLRRVRK